MLEQKQHSREGMFMFIWNGQSCKLSICFCFDLLSLFVVVPKLAPLNSNRTNVKCIKCNKSKTSTNPYLTCDQMQDEIYMIFVFFI